MTSYETWTAVDQYYTDLLIESDPVLEEALRASDAAELPQINVAPNQGKLLHMLVKMHGAKTLLEIGTLGGYSTIWLARALPDNGRLITLEYEPHHAEVARANIERAGLSDKVEIRVGAAADHLPTIAGEGHIFDFVFIDADKPSNPIYFDWSLKLTRPGGVIILDNVARSGAVIDADSVDESVQGTRQVLEMIANEPRIEATAIQTVGSKGYDGFCMMRVK